ncbi:MAG: MFS transporter [Gemmatimonadetes bacterium]|nr:MFS transporter [Gemmatimonadota bacterium]NNM04016.1 MFS transporter [Gemmatimonadota bacterium]
MPDRIDTPLFKVLKKIIPVERDEWIPVLLATAYGFCILLSYYILRPVRDEISAEDRGNLQILWTAVFFVMVLAVPLYSSAVSRFSRAVFIPLANRFFALNLVLFYVALQFLPLTSRPWIDRVFYVWTSVFALFVVTVFWGFIVDLFRNRQGKRVFGFIAMGSSAGGLVGSLVVTALATKVPTFVLLLIAILPLEFAAWFAWFLHRRAGEGQETLRVEKERVPGNAWSGIRLLAKSPYLLTIGAFIFLMTYASTVLYFHQGTLVRDFIPDRGARTEFYGWLDFWTNFLTLFGQMFVAAHILKWLRIGMALAIVPGIALLGYLGLGLYPTLMVVAVFSIFYRAGRYSIARPAREVLFTVVNREERYKSKAFIDAAVYRGGDLVNGWVITGLEMIGLTLAGIAFVAVPVMGVWMAVGFYLGRSQEERSRVWEEKEPASAEPEAG